jgi:peptidoglycan/xylan/chitin deacetylase (PgdA/CDA1 family)
MRSNALRGLTIATLLATSSLFAAPSQPDLPSATILCYHIIESPADPLMEISRETFQQQLRYLIVTGYTVVPLRDIYEYAIGKRASLPKNPVAITVDDGWRSTYTEIFPEMKRQRLPFTVFIYPKIIGRTAYALTWKQIKEMAEDGVDIESHSYSHPFLTRRRHASLDEQQYAEWLERELVESKRILEHETGRTVSFLAYPYGDYDHILAASVAKAGYDAALTCDYGRITPGNNPFRMKRVVIDKRMDFAAFRHYLGARPMQIAQMTPPAGPPLDSADPLTISARIPNYKSLDPTSVGIALVSMAGSLPYSYDAGKGLISLIVGDELKGKLQRALVWATEAKSGHRVEASWTFRLPGENLLNDPAFCPPIDPNAQPVPMVAPGAVSGGVRAGSNERLQIHRGSRE